VIRATKATQGLVGLLVRKDQRENLEIRASAETLGQKVTPEIKARRVFKELED
jgi:hypothetical protein